MALSTTTLSSAVAVNDTTIKVASATSFTAGDYVLVDQEFMKVTQNYGTAPFTSTTIPVLRGRNGTVNSAHVVTANVTRGLASDFALPVATTMVTEPVVRGTQIQSITATSTLTLPPGGGDQRIILNGTSVITLTIPVPTKDMDGCKLSFIPNGVAAHVLTFTGGLSGASTGYTKFTVNASAPAAFEVFACNGVWVAPAQIPASGTVTNITGAIS